MRNITLLRDQLLALSPPSSVNASLSPAIVCIAHDKSSSQFFALTQTGSIYCCSEVDDGYRVIRILYVSQHTDESILSNSCYRWFDVSYLAGTGVLVCLSYNGDIVSFELDGPTIMDGFGDQIGVIDGGIAAAAWSPDRECLVLLTNNSSILCMSSSWEVLYEVALPADMATDAGTGADVSWKGDGEHFALISVDKGDNQAKLRIYNKHLELSVTARNVVEGPGSVMKGIGRVVAFSSSGNYVSVFQERIRGRLQVALVEPNGLRHGDFDLQLPPVPLGCDKWTETSIAWDLTSSIVAIGLVAVQSRIGEGCDGSSRDLAVVSIGLVQFYTRSNYHWYLKQQWIAEGLRFLRFDEESVGRCYMSMASPTATDPGRMSCPVLRLIDFTWDTCYSASSNGTVAVVDGSKLLLTPLGWCTVPPPLSKHVVSIASTGPVDRLQTLSGPCCRCTCFWTPTMESGDAVDTVSWGLAALTDDSSSVVLVIGDGSGAPITRYSLDLAAAVGIRRRVMLRSMVAAQSDKHLIIALVGSELMHVAASSPSPGSSERLLLLKLLLHNSGPEICSVAEVTGFRGLIACICPVPADPTSIVLGVMDHSRNEFEIFRADCSSAFSVHTQDVEVDSRALVFGVDVSVELVAVVPELCSHIAFISNHLKGGSNSYHRDQSDEPVQYAAVALSSKNRLYFGDSYLAEGVSSFAYNPSFQMLLYTTLGMKPHLHFCSLEGLQSFEPHQNDDRGGGFECAAPRPIERGSKIVIAVHGSSKVVLQLPRGNLECIEPRPLILLKAQHLLTSNQLFQCFVLLRKQRVDLNFLVDFDPMLFLSGVETMINAMLADNPDSISLFVTALEPVDTTLTKYPLRDKARVAVVDELVARGFQGDGKVNSVCRSVRNVLLPILHAARVQDGASSPLLLQCTRIIQPILCTYARQRPPAIVEALQLIRSCSSPSSSHVPELSAPLAQVSIKYLTFLADGSSLFDAALGECDFLMSRAVARLCQMDPKSYLPLIERFESIGTTESESPQEAAMHFRVNVHLKRWVKAVDWAVETLRRFLALRIGPAPDCCWDEDAFEVCFRLVRDVMQDFELLLRENGLFAQAVPRVVGLDCRLPTPIDNHIDGDVQTQLYHRRDLFYRALVNGLRLQFGRHCWAQKDYSGALSLFMSTQPMHALEAIEAARILGHWRLALTIADKYRLDDRYAKDDRLNPQRIAREIVNEFRENLDQGGSFIGSYTAGAEASPSLSSADRILAVAHLCEEYCRDPEGAISILTAGHRWMQALRLAFRYNRDDLSSEVLLVLSVGLAPLNVCSHSVVGRVTGRRSAPRCSQRVYARLVSTGR